MSVVPLTPLSSIIIVSFNTREMLKACLSQLFKYSGKKTIEVFVVDNNSHDGSADMVEENFKNVFLIRNIENKGFAAACLQAYEKVTGDCIVLLNPDAIVEEGALTTARHFLEKYASVGMVGGKLINESGHLAPSARTFPSAWSKFLMLSGLSDRFSHIKFFGGHDYKWFDHKKLMAVDWVPGAFCCIRKKMLDEIGFFDDRFFLYYEETDLCLRASKNGWKVYFLPEIVVKHIGGASCDSLEEKVIDKGASQVMKFRMMAECLYFRKNYSVLSVALNMGVELAWFWLRAVSASIRKDKAKHDESMDRVNLLLMALKETQWGGKCPPKPWK